MELMKNGFNNTLNIGKKGFDWAIGMKPPEQPKGRLATMGSEFVSWITVSPQAPEVWGDGKLAKAAQNIHDKGQFVLVGPEPKFIETSYPGQNKTWEWCKGTYSRAAMLWQNQQPQAEAPHGLKRMAMIAVRVGIVLATSAIAIGTAYGAGIGLQKAGQALVSQSDFAASALATSGEYIKILSDTVSTFAKAIYAGFVAASEMAFTAAVWCKDKVLPKINEVAEQAFVALKQGMAWLNEAFVQPAIESLPGLRDRIGETSAKILPCLKEAAAIGMEYLKPTTDYLYELGSRGIKVVTSAF